MLGKRIRTLAAVGVLALSGTGYALYRDQQAERRPLPAPLSLPSSSSPASETSSIPPSVLGDTTSQDVDPASESAFTSLPSTESPLLRLRWQESARQQLANGDFVIQPDGVLALARRAVTAGILGRHVIEARHIDSHSITSRTIRDKTVTGDDLADDLSLGTVMVREGLTVSGDTTLVGDLDVAGIITGSFAGAFAPSGDVDMTTHILTNIGDNGTDFTNTGGLTLADTLTVSGGGASIAGALSLPSLTASRLLATDGSNQVVPASLSAWLSGTDNQVTVTDDGDGTATLSLPQSIHTGASPTFAGMTLTGLTPGAVPFIGAGGVLSEDPTNLYWDGTNHRLGIGTGSPGRKLSIQGTDGNYDGILLSGDDSSIKFTNAANTVQRTVIGYNVVDSSGYLGPAGSSYVYASANKLSLNTSGGYPVILQASPGGGNVGIGDSTPASLLTVGNGDLFQVNSSGAIAAATGITSSGTITFSGLSTAGLVTNTSGGVLGTTTTLGASYITADSLDFTEFKDALTLDASTDISVTGTNVFSLTNSGTGNSFVVNDQAGDTTPFVIDASGNVGIGTVSPSYKFQVIGASNISSPAFNTSTMTQGILNGSMQLRLTGTSNANVAGQFYSGISFGEDANSTTAIASYDDGGSQASGLAIFTGSGNTILEALRITSAGNVGIGTTTPGYQLDITGSAKADTLKVNQSGGFQAVTGSWPGSPAGDNLGWFAIGWADSNVYHRLRTAGSGNDNLMLDIINPSTHYFSVNGQFNSIYGATIGYSPVTPPTNGLAVSGNVGIGTPNPGTKLAVAGLTGTSSYNLVRVDTATGNFYYDSSSARYKDDIHPFEEDFSKILDLSVKEYTDKTSQESEIGLIAEELDAAGLSHLVISKDGVPDAIKYDRIPMYLLGVLQTQDKRLSELEAKTEDTTDPASTDTIGTLTALSLDTLLMKDSDGNLDLGDGTLLAKKVEAETVEASASVTAPKMVTNSLSVGEDKDAPTLGTAEIKAGETEVTVETEAVTEQSRIFVTPEVALGEAPAVTERKDGKSFTVDVLNAPEKDLPFSWWIVESGAKAVSAPVTP